MVLIKVVTGFGDLLAYCRWTYTCVRLKMA
jgi:hypothetical protein